MYLREVISLILIRMIVLNIVPSMVVLVKKRYSVARSQIYFKFIDRRQLGRR